MWIDAVNMPHDENNWKTFADEALKNGKCRVLILFRSEISLSKRTIKDEVETFHQMDGSEHNIIAVDIYHEKGLHTRYLRNRNSKKELKKEIILKPYAESSIRAAMHSGFMMTAMKTMTCSPAGSQKNCRKRECHPNSVSRTGLLKSWMALSTYR